MNEWYEFKIDVQVSGSSSIFCARLYRSTFSHFSMNAKRETKNSGINGRRLRRNFVPSSFLCKFTYLFTNLQIFPLAVNKDLRSVFPRGLCKDYMKRE